MTGRRLLLAGVAALFVAWLAWLAVAVARKHEGEVISRAQLAHAAVVLVAEVKADAAGLPESTTAVVEVAWRNPAPLGPVPPLAAGQPLEVANLPEAQLPAGGFPGPGRYLLLLRWDEGRAAVAGLPRSPGYAEATPARPVVYRWDAKAEGQLRGLTGD